MVERLSDIDLAAAKDVKLLTDVGYFYSMAHNIDLGTAERAKGAFERALQLEPENVRANYLLGMFLSSTRKYQSHALSYLRKALALGEADAKYTLGFLLVQKGERDKGLSYLREYAKAHPELDRPRKMTEGIESGKMKLRTD